jgi:hypothetical protein
LATSLHPVPLSKTQIALYAVLAVGVFAGLAYGLPVWQIIAIAVVVGIADALTDREPLQPEAPASWPWQRAAFWVVLALFVVLATSLAYVGAPVGVNVLICSLGLAFYGYHVARQIEARRAQIRGTTVLAAALTRYAMNPDARSELARHDRLAAPRA